MLTDEFKTQEKRKEKKLEDYIMLYNFRADYPLYEYDEDEDELEHLFIERIKELRIPPKETDLKLTDQILFELEQISEDSKGNLHHMKILSKEVRIMNQKFDLLLSLISQREDINQEVKDRKSKEIETLSGKQKTELPEFANLKERIEFVRKRIKEIGPTSTKPGNECE